uniref:Uncharacterized protein n=1 Tax=Manihot esculenta TaxID=3983 RepID=A0A2C9V5U9_MANES
MNNNLITSSQILETNEIKPTHRKKTSHIFIFFDCAWEDPFSSTFVVDVHVHLLPFVERQLT